MVWCGVMLCGVIPCGMVWYILKWCVVMRCGLISCRMVWCGGWYGVVSDGVVCAGRAEQYRVPVPQPV